MYLIRKLFASTLCLAIVLVLVVAVAPAALAIGPYVIGSSNTLTADPTIPRPPTTPCVVTLFTDYTFDNNYNLNPFSYTPPENCPGPWANVVLEVDISVTAGNQFDRAANRWLPFPVAASVARGCQPREPMRPLNNQSQGAFQVDE